MVTKSDKFSWPIYLGKACPINPAHKLRGNYKTGLTTCIDCEKEYLIEAFLRKFSYARCPYCSLTFKKNNVVHVEENKIVFECECNTIVKLVIIDGP